MSDDNAAIPDAGGRGSGRIAVAKRRIEETRSRVIAARTRHVTIDVALDLSVRDIDTGGAVLAGAIAFRVFLWTLPATLVGAGILGFSERGARLRALGFGLGGVTANAIGAAAENAHRARWALLLIGLVLLVSVSRTLGVTVHTAFALTWQLPIRKPGSYLTTAGVTGAVMIGLLVIAAACSWLRHHSLGLGVGVTLATVLVWTAVWWGVSTLLPHRPVPWWGLLPGACLVGLGMGILHFVVVLYLAPKVSSSSALYGSLGAAATLLLGGYLLSRIILASAALNATIHTKLVDTGGR